MITFMLEGHDWGYAIQTMIQVFYPNQKYQAVAAPGEGICIKSGLSGSYTYAVVYEDGKERARAESSFPETASLADKKQLIKRPVYEALRCLTGYNPPWGLRTGIRPAKKINELMAEGFSPEAAQKTLEEVYDVKPNKARLALSVALTEQHILEDCAGDDASLYIGIPFCPTRCLYCSFTSYPLSRFQTQVDAYLGALKQELAYLSALLEGKKLSSIYIGGGTPTALNEMQLEDLLNGVEQLFAVGSLKEFTVEAGRPDTITEEKLRSMKRHGVSRISINPQTMNDETLALVGREHSVADIVSAYELARATGHENINMDLILGLPGETVDHVRHTMDMVAKLQPESVTVHTLAVKRASRLNETIENYTLTGAEEMEQMLDLAQSRTEDMGLKPYYLYRQKNMLGSFENVGYARPGCESPYNVLIMEEAQTIFAAGCGGVTKVVEGSHIDRVFNVKSLEDYIARIDEMIGRKQQRFGR